MKDKKLPLHSYGAVAVTAGVIGGWLLLLYFVSPEDIVARVGVQNTYVVTFIFAVFAGVSSLTSTSFYTLIATFAAGGSSPVLMGLAGGVGAFISNVIFYFAFLYGKQLLTGRWKRWAEASARHIERYPRWVLIVIVYVYAGFTPLPDDILMAALALSSYSFMRFAPVLFLANCTLVTLIALLAQFFS